MDAPSITQLLLMQQRQGMISEGEKKFRIGEVSIKDGYNLIRLEGDSLFCIELMKEKRQL